MKKPLPILFLFLIICSRVVSQPVISFFNEMKSPQLVTLFSDTTIIPDLQDLGAEIRMGMMDLTQERASVIRQLNEAGISVVAWLLLPEDQGYWFHSRNSEAAFRRYDETKKWIKENNLQIKGIGIDLEIDMNDVTLFKSSPWKMVLTFYKRLYDKTALEEGTKKYNELVNLIQSDGYRVESYYIPFIKDEVSIKRMSLQRMTGIIDIHTEMEIPMLYSSFMGNPDGLLKIYGKDVHAGSVALGSTGGGVDPTFPTLTYDNLVHDLNVASEFADELHIFSLEGCIEKGYLKQLTDYKPDHSAAKDLSQERKVKTIQKIVRIISFLLSYPTLFLVGIVLIPLGLAGLGIYLIVKLLILLINLIFGN